MSVTSFDISDCRWAWLASSSDIRSSRTLAEALAVVEKGVLLLDGSAEESMAILSS